MEVHVRKQNIIRIVVIAAVIAFAVWKFATIPPVISEIPGEHAAEGFRYNGKYYSSSNFMVADEDRIHVGYAKETRGKVYFIGSRISPDYIVIVGSDNTSNYAADGCVPESSGTVTKVLVDPGIRAKNNKVIIKKSDIETLLAITRTVGEERDYVINNIYTKGNVFYFAYNDCVVVQSPDNLGGYIALVDGEWIYASPENYRAMLDSVDYREGNMGTVRAIRISDEKMIDWLEKSIVTRYIEE